MHTFRVASALALVGLGALTGCAGRTSPADALRSAESRATTSATSASAAGSAATLGSTPTGLAPTASARTASIPSASARTASKPLPSTTPTGASTVKATLTAIVVQLSDLPGPWTAHAVPSDDHGGPGSADDPYSDCVGPDTSRDLIRDIDSPDFWRDDATVSSDAAMFTSESDVDADVASLIDPKNRHCDAKGIGHDMMADEPKGARLVSSTATMTARVSGQPANLIANEAAIVRITTPDETDTIYVNDAYIRGPRIEVFVDFINLGAPVSASVRAAVIAKVAARAAKA